MHRCLAIPEILHLICSQLRDDVVNWGDLPSRRSLAALATASWAWHEPAIAGLWFEIEGLDTLVRCMPQDLWQRNDKQELVLRRPILRADMEVLSKYAGHIRYFIENEYPSPSLHHALLSHCQGPLLPRLKRLRWLTDGECFSNIRFFLPRSLERLEILSEDQTNHEKLLNLLSSIPISFCSNITDLYVSFCDVSPGLPSASRIDRFLPQWQSLSSLEIFGAPPNALWCTSQMPNLRSLAVNLLESPNEPPPTSLSAYTSPHHSPIEELSIEKVTAISDIVGFFEAHKLTNIRSLYIEILPIQEGSSTATKVLLGQIASSCCNTLESFVLDHDSYNGPFPSIITPLLRFSNLKRVQFGLGRLTDVSDREISRISSSWSSTVSLCIKSKNLPPIRLPPSQA
ncbi:hypothetical protein NP233_g2386 [Leucocoprinus birnbaumii]|uniref:F-box domain-containing protein n=1 Tax=Leucocoprinus birnbaumii TaxID=56174 RepID=A0AAD5VYD4_9AGAR|nr:hypothetical protein NP233_g2386 [Leucocoprinus birnbaumii]